MVRLQGLLDRNLNPKQMLTLVISLAMTVPDGNKKHLNDLISQAEELSNDLSFNEVEECISEANTLVFIKGFPNVTKEILDNHLDSMEDKDV